MQSKDKNFWRYVLNYARWLINHQQLWKIVLPLYLIVAAIWFNVYYQDKLTSSTLSSNQRLEQRVDSLQKVLSHLLVKQKQGFDLILRDVMGDYGQIMPKKAVFLGKNVPINHLFARQTLNWIFRYLFMHKAEVRDALERFHFYETAIGDSLKKYGLPLDLKYVFLAESWAYPLAISQAGAAGGWQFMPYTAINLNVEINKDVDMRRDPWYMSKIFCNYIDYLRRHSYSPQAALRAYNTGINRFLSAAARQSWVTKTWFIDVNDENNIYLFWVLAWKLIYEQPLKFGIKINYNFPPLKIKTVKAKIDRWYYRDNLTFLDIARAIQIDVILLKNLNPAFLKLNKKGERIIPGPRRKRYIVRYLKLPAQARIENLNQIKIRGVKFLIN